MSAPPGVVGRYAIYDELASGGMATVYLGKLEGAVGFSRVVAIKRLHPQFAKDAEFSAMFMDEARLAARIHHPNVVQTLDVVALDRELLLVMEYVHGLALSQLATAARRKGKRPPPAVVASILAGALDGLHAAHEAKDEHGAPLGVVHRDMSPQNVLVTPEGQARLLDFGVAKAAGKLHATREGQIKGKIAYMSPEQVRGQAVDRRSDVFSSAIVLWEMLTGEPLFRAQNAAELILLILDSAIEPPSAKNPAVPAKLDEVVMRGMARDPAKRFASAGEMAAALEAAIPLASPREVGAWINEVAPEALSRRAALVASVERRAAASRDSMASNPSLPGPASQSGPRLHPEPDMLTRRDRTPVGFERAGFERARSDPSSSSGPLSDPLLARARSEPSGVSSVRGRSEPSGVSGSSPPGPRGSSDPMVARGVSEPSGSRSISSPSSPGAPLDRDSFPPLLSPTLGRRPMRPRAPQGPSMTELLTAPGLTVGVGAVIAIADMALRAYTQDLPIRLTWVATVLIAAGAIWGFARVFLRKQED